MSSPTNPYAAAHVSPQGEGDARPTAMQIIRDEDLVNKMTDKVFLVTGTSSGIGGETVRALHATGAHIFMTARDMAKGEAVMKDILASSEGTGKLELLEMELGSFESIRNCTKELLKKTDKLNVLVNNAGQYRKNILKALSKISSCIGIRNPPESTTEDGFETQFGTNHLGHFLLFQLLLPTLLSSSTPTFASRVLNVTSGAHRDSPINLDNLNLKGIYTPRLGYSHSKTANILMANEIERRYAKQGLHALSISPGAIASGAQRYDDPEHLKAALVKMKNVVKTQPQGAATTIWGAVAKVMEGKGGLYLEDCAVATEIKEGVIGGFAKHAFDEESERKLWEVSCEMVDISQ